MFDFKIARHRGFDTIVEFTQFKDALGYTKVAVNFNDSNVGYHINDDVTPRVEYHTPQRFKELFELPDEILK
jgi:hypothetical protein